MSFSDFFSIPLVHLSLAVLRHHVGAALQGCGLPLGMHNGSCLSSKPCDLYGRSPRSRNTTVPLETAQPKVVGDAEDKARSMSISEALDWRFSKSAKKGNQTRKVHVRGNWRQGKTDDSQLLSS